MYVMSGMGATAAGEKCELACYEAKSKAYQVCQKLPLDKRAAKVACFQKADVNLKACINKCGAPSGALIATIAGIGALVLMATA
jgi:sulfite reductase beta subunit-like hemoprotein